MICEASEDAIPDAELREEREDLDETLATFGLLQPDEEVRTPLDPLWEVSSASPTIASRKFAKNRTLRAMSHVCRTWRVRLTHSRCLWRDIAFDVTEPKSIRLAKDFLDAVRDSTISLHIYAGLGRTVYPEVSALLQDLRTYTGRWEVFKYQGELKGYRQYLDLEARRLLHFSDRHDFSSALLSPQKIFAGRAPVLRSLSTSEIGNWTPAALSNITELNIAFCQRGAPFSLKTLIDVFRGTPNLEALQLASPKPLVVDCAVNEAVDLPRLEILRLYNTGIYTLLSHLQLPGACSMMLSSSYSRWSPRLAFQGNIFSPFPSITLLDRAFSLVEIRIGFLRNGTLRFSIHLSTDDECFFGIHLNLVGERWCRWESYFKRSIMELAERVRLCPDAHLQFASDIPLDCDPLSRFDTIRFLTFGGHGRDVLHTLARNSHGTPPAIPFPHLEELTLSDDQINYYDIPLIPSCLRFRKGLFIVVSDVNGPLLQTVDNLCVIERRPTSSNGHPQPTDSPL